MVPAASVDHAVVMFAALKLSSDMQPDPSLSSPFGSTGGGWLLPPPPVRSLVSCASHAEILACSSAVYVWPLWLPTVMYVSTFAVETKFSTIDGAATIAVYDISGSVL